MTSTRCIINILSLSRMTLPFNLTVAYVSRPSNARTCLVPPGGLETVGNVTLYDQALSATHSHLSSLKPRKGSSILQYHVSVVYGVQYWGMRESLLIVHQIKMDVSWNTSDRKPFFGIRLFELPAFGELLCRHCSHCCFSRRSRNRVVEARPSEASTSSKKS